MGPVFVCVSRLAFDGSTGPYERTVEVAEETGATVILGDYPSESLHRQTGMEEVRKRGFRFCIIPDSDEVVSSELLANLIKLAESGVASRVHVHMDTYWKSPEFVVRPREGLTPAILIDLDVVNHVHIREFAGGTKLVLGPEFGILHHLSYALPAERISRKLGCWSHKSEVVAGWEERVFRGWDFDPLMRDLHPTHPQAYKRIEKIVVPEELRSIALDPSPEILPCVPWPKVSVVIPLHGGERDIRRCLTSLVALGDLVHEIIVVDDKSPDKAAEVAASFSGIRLFANEKNLGFAGTSNVGYRESTGEVILFLNSDTIVPYAGYVRLIESLMASRSIGAAGPLSNNTGHHQQIDSTYESIETMPLFADLLARTETPDQDVDMLVGFCLAIRREVLEETGAFDERFGIGMFEDNDLCYRIRRAGFRLVLAKRAFVHHEGSKSLARRKEHPAVLLTRNEAIYRQKWKDDLECGYCSHLSGMAASPIVFEPKNKPEEIDKRIRRLAKQANICLCMIVKNEERVLGACLESIVKGVTQLVILDTGSTDGTLDIACQFDPELYQIKWPDSYSEARNVSLRYARRPWIMWIDADDTVDRKSLEAILRAVINAPKNVGGFVVPVRFVDGGPTGGIQVDHVKVFRAAPGVCFEGRIHEQNLASIRRTGKDIGLVKDACVWHSGYDTSPEGQKIKREREKLLLRLDHEEDPGHPFKMFNLGMTANAVGEHEAAVDWLTRSIAASGPDESHLRKAYAMLGHSRRELGDAEGALATFAEGLIGTPDDPELLFQSGTVLSDMGRLHEAKEMYLRVREDARGLLGSLDLGMLTFKRFHNLGAIDLALGNYGEARKWWKMAIQVAPGFAPSSLSLFEAAMTQADYRTAGEALDALKQAEGPTEGWTQRMLRLAVEMGRDPGQVLGQILHSYPYAFGPLLIRARSLVEAGDLYGAAPFLEELDRLGCAEGAFLRGVCAMQQMDLWAALVAMSRARDLNPGHEATEKHILELTKMLDSSVPPPLELRGRAVLQGPHAGTLGPCSCHASVVVVSYNSARTIGKCIHSVLSTIGPGDELIVVDNASTDGTRLVLQGITDSRLQVIQQESNLGYSKAANIGLLASKGEILVTLNPDAYVNSGWIDALASRLDDDIAAVGPMSDNVGGDQFVGHLLGERHPALRALPTILAEEFAGKTQETLFLVGICVAVKRETLNMHGLLDEGTELGADDLEFSFRMRMLGYRVVIAQDVFVQHEQGVSFASLPHPERVARQVWSDFALIRKLEAFYDGQPIPSSMELWGTPIFDEAFLRYRLIRECDGSA